MEWVYDDGGRAEADVTQSDAPARAGAVMREGRSQPRPQITLKNE